MLMAPRARATGEPYGELLPEPLGSPWNKLSEQESQSHERVAQVRPRASKRRCPWESQELANKDQGESSGQRSRARFT